MHQAIAETVAMSPIDHSANLFGKGSDHHRLETDAFADDYDPDPYADVEPPAPTPRPRRSAFNAFKPGTRQLTQKAVTGERPWWASDDPAVWQQKHDEFKRNGGLETRNVIGWKDTGLSGGVGR